MLLGRGAEQSRIDALLAEARGGISGSLAIRGAPGIGKTALLRYAIGRGADMTVLRASGVESESDLPFSGLSDVLRPAMGLLDQIPRRQADALAGALAIGPPAAQDRLTILAATHRLLAASAEQRPILVAVDDAHWLDVSSRDALLFAGRRLQADRAALIFTARDGEPVEFNAPHVPDLVLEGIDQQACDGLLAGSGAMELSPAVARTILRATAGNPLAIMEAASLLSQAQLAGHERFDEPLPLGTQMQRSFARRVGLLPTMTRAALVVVAASQSRAIDEVRRACEMLRIEPAALELAERERLIEKDGVRVQFAHPLMRSAAYHAAPPPERRAAHRALASVLAGETYASERAWQLAAAADGVDEEVARALDEAGRQARERTGHASASRAFERAARLTPEPEQRARRFLEAGSDAHFAGESARALRLLGEALPHAREAALSADIEHTRARVAMRTGSPAAARKILLATADMIEPHDPARAAMILVDATTTCFQEGDPEDGIVEPALAIARRAHALGSPVGGLPDAAASGLLGKALVCAGRAAEGRPHLIRCLAAMEQTDSLWVAVQLIQCAVVFLWLEEYENARRPVEALISRARAASLSGALAYPLCNLSEVEFRTGRWQEAFAAAAEAVGLARNLGQTATLQYALLCLAWVEAGLGREQDCRRHAAAALELAGPGGITIAGYAMAVLGLLELGLGNSEQAVEQLSGLLHVYATEGVDAVEQGLFQFMPNLIEAYVRAGARAEAESALETLQAAAVATRRNWTTATAARCRGMLAEVSFDEHFEEALRLHALTPTPFERARTELCYGERLRRARRRTEARARLSRALETFEQLGAEPWAERAREQLRSAGEAVRRRAGPGLEQLTAQELDIALRVARGATNKEVAGAVYLSPKTVEAQLSRIYSKLGIRSRTELAHRLRQQSVGAQMG
jgi:DNA-binding CsgD family transcriptional regulator